MSIPSRILSVREGRAVPGLDLHSNCCNPGRVGDEGLGRLDFLIEVSTSNSGSFNDQFAHTTDGHKFVVVSGVNNPESTSASSSNSGRLGLDELVV